MRPTKKEIEKYLINKFMGSHGGLNPKNISYELNDGYEFVYTKTIKGNKGITIKKKMTSSRTIGKQFINL